MASEGCVGGRRRSGRRRAAPTGTVSFLFTDIEGSTRLLEQLRGKYAELLADHRRILREAFTAWQGHEVDTQGDSFFVAFPRAADALGAALAGQRALAAFTWPSGADVRVRMGIHTGEPLVASQGYVGMAVHRAARIAAVSRGGAIVISGTTRDLVADELPEGVDLIDLGAHELKDMKSETRLYQVVGGGLDSVSALAPASPMEIELPPAPGEPPYRGLQAFEEHDAENFFGREQIVHELVTQLRGARFVALIGASGSGKSSILRAGVIPALRQPDPPWRVLLLTPTAHPFEALASSIWPDAAPAELSKLTAQLRADPGALAVALRPPSGAGPRARRRTLLAVDQLEEVFTLCRDEAERTAFLDAIVHACGIDEAAADVAPEVDRATVAITLRADFYGFLAPYPALRDASAASQRFVGAMSAAEMRTAIEEPARRGGWQLTPGLVELMLSDAGDEPGALPLLSHALLETWRRRQGRTMTLRSYGGAGGVRGAIARTADRVYGELSPAAQRIARNVFVRLTELGEGTQDTRRRATFEELLPADQERAAEIRQVVSALADARLVTVGETTVEVAHEALIREWPLLREWLSVDRDALRLERRLTEAATEWQAAGFDESLLWRGARLAQVRDRSGFREVLSDIEQRFVAESAALGEREEAEHEAARQRELEAAQALAAAEAKRAEEAARSAAGLRRRAVLLVGALVVAGVLAGVAVVLAQQAADNAAIAGQSAEDARANAARAEAAAQEAKQNEELALAQAQQTRAQQLASDASQILQNGRGPELAALLALAGLDAAYTSDGDAVLQQASRLLSGHRFDHDESVVAIAVTPDGDTLFTAAGDLLHVWDVDTATELTRLVLPREGAEADPYWQLWLSDDGSTLLASDYFGRATMWRLDPERAGEPTPIAEGCEALERGVHAMSADGQTVTNWEEDQLRAWRMPECESVGPPITAIDLNDPALSADGGLAVGSILDHSILAVWDLASGRQVSRVERLSAAFWHASFSSDGSQVAVGMFDGTAQLFDAASGELLRTFRGHSGEVERAILVAGDTRLLTSSFDATARLWDVSSAIELNRFVHSDVVRQSTMSADGLEVFTASYDGTARQWSAGGEEVAFIAGSGEVGSLSFSADGTRVLSAAPDSIRLFDLATASVVVDASAPGVLQAAISDSGDQILAVSTLSVALLDATTRDGRLLRELAHSQGFQNIPSAAAFSPDGQRMLAPALGSDGLVRFRPGKWPHQVLQPRHGGAVERRPFGRRLVAVRNRRWRAGVLQGVRRRHGR